MTTMFPRSFFVDLMSLFGCREAAKVCHRSIERNLRHIGFFDTPLFEKIHPLKPSAVVAIGGIGSILAIGRLAQVLKSVIVSGAIYVVDLVYRPFAGDIEPRKAMCRIRFPVNFEINVSFVVKVARFLTHPYLGPRRGPGKIASFLVIGKDFEEMGMRDFFHPKYIPCVAGYAKS